MLNDSSAINNLLLMTPFGWNIPPNIQQKVAALQHLETNLAFQINVWQQILLASTTVANAEQAKLFDLKTLDGQISSIELKGQVVYLDFWASWCGPCRKSFPWMNKMYDKYQAKGLEIVAVNLDPNREHADEFLKKIPVHFTVALDPEGKTADAYNVQVMPTSFLIGLNGEILWEHKGFRSSRQDDMEAKIAKVLK